MGWPVRGSSQLCFGSTGKEDRGRGVPKGASGRGSLYTPVARGEPRSDDEEWLSTEDGKMRRTTTSEGDGMLGIEVGGLLGGCTVLRARPHQGCSTGSGSNGGLVGASWLGTRG